MKHARSIMLPACLLAAGIAAGAQEMEITMPGSTALVEDAADWDGRTVSFTGEAIGEAMRRGDHAWIHLNDDAYGLADAGVDVPLAGYNSGIGVWLDARQASTIAVFGDNRHHGDLVEVTGVFHAACPQHGGDLDIHASSLRVARAGYATFRRILPSRMIAAAILAGLTLALFLVNLRADRRREGSERRPG